nr:hypothetical protein [Tanacetum cinerariifolium]
MFGQYVQRKEEEKRIEEEQAAKAQNWKLPVCYDDDDDEKRSISLKDNIISGLPLYVAITPISSTEEPDNSLSIEDEHLDTVLATESDEFIKSSVESLVPMPSESEDQFEDFSNSNDDSTLYDDDSFFIDNIEYVEASPPNSELVSSEVKLSDLKQALRGRHPMLIKYEAFYNAHVKEIRSGNTTTHSDSSLYDSFIFDLSVNPFPPADRSNFYEFADELTHIISPPEYDCFYFKIGPSSGDFTMDVVEDTFPTREPRVHKAFPTHPTLQLNLNFILSSESLFSIMLYGSFFLSSHIQLLLNIFYPSRMKIPFLISASSVIISLLSCRMYLIGVELS